MTTDHNPAEAWDRLVASALQRISTPTSEPRSTATLRLQPVPTVRHLPTVQRNVAEISGTVRTAIRLLVSGQSPWPLVLHGSAGTGKTCAGLALLDYAEGEYHTAAGLCASLIQVQQGGVTWESEGRSGDVTPEMFWRQIGRAPLLVLDELGSRERVSDFAYETIKRAIDDRQGKPLMVLSNFGLDRIEQLYDDRIASRLASGTVVRLEGKDRRLRA